MQAGRTEEFISIEEINEVVKRVRKAIKSLGLLCGIESLGDDGLTPSVRLFKGKVLFETEDG